MRRLLFLLFVLVVAGFAYLCLAPVNPGRESFVVFPPGTGSQAMARRLQANGIIRSRSAFELLRLLKRGTMKAGEYRFEGAESALQVYNRIERGDVYYRSVTIPEGYNLFDIAAAVAGAQLGTADQFLLAARRDVALIRDLDPGAQSLEGYLFPDTYKFQRSDTPESMLRAMVKRFRVEAAELGITGNTHDVVTLASLVEKETPTPGDRPLVASVLQNRLRAGMPLMTDPTVIYAAMLVHQYRGTIYASDLQRESAYNTYKHAGLPPGPICSPGAASLAAALHPAQSSYLYFVADAAGGGRSRFATTLEEHEHNVQAYRQAKREDGTPAAPGGRSGGR